MLIFIQLIFHMELLAVIQVKVMAFYLTNLMEGFQILDMKQKKLF